MLVNGIQTTADEGSDDRTPEKKRKSKKRKRTLVRQYCQCTFSILGSRDIFVTYTHTLLYDPSSLGFAGIYWFWWSWQQLLAIVCYLIVNVKLPLQVYSSSVSVSCKYLVSGCCLPLVAAFLSHYKLRPQLRWMYWLTFCPPPHPVICVV